MDNVLPFPNPHFVQASQRRGESKTSPNHLDGLRNLKDRAKVDLYAAVILFGIAVEHGRRAKDLLSDLAGRKRLEDNIAIIEGMLEKAKLEIERL